MIAPSFIDLRCSGCAQDGDTQTSNRKCNLAERQWTSRWTSQLVTVNQLWLLVDQVFWHTYWDTLRMTPTTASGQKSSTLSAPSDPSNGPTNSIFKRNVAVPAPAPATPPIIPCRLLSSFLCLSHHDSSIIAPPTAQLISSAWLLHVDHINDRYLPCGQDRRRSAHREHFTRPSHLISNATLRFTEHNRSPSKDTGRLNRHHDLMVHKPQPKF